MITFEIDPMCVLTVTAQEAISGVKETLIIPQSAFSFQVDELVRHLTEEEQQRALLNSCYKMNNDIVQK